MKDYTTIIDLIQTAPFLAVFYFLWKSGAIKIGNGKKNGNGYQCQIDDLKSHAKVANKEMGEMNKRMGKIEGHMEFIRGVISKRPWNVDP